MIYYFASFKSHHHIYEKYFFFLRVLTPIVSCNKTKHLTSSLLIKVLSSMYMKKQRWLPPTSIDAARESSAAFEGLSNNAHYGWILNCLVGLWKGTIYGLRLNMAENENTFVILQSLLTCAVFIVSVQKKNNSHLEKTYTNKYSNFKLYRYTL